MKRKEMIEKIDDNFNGKIFVKVGCDNNLCIYCNDGFSNFFICRINEFNQYIFSIEQKNYSLLEKDEQEKLFNIIVEYSMTPPEDRKEELRYQYFLPEVCGLFIEEYDSNHSCLNYDRNCGVWTWRNDEDTEDYQTIFTHKELRKLGVDVEELREKYQEIKVEY